MDIELWASVWLQKRENPVAPWDPCFFGGARAVLFRQTENFSRQTKIFSARQHFKSSPPPLPSTTLTISDNIDNFPTGLNNRAGHATPLLPPPPPSHGATGKTLEIMPCFWILIYCTPVDQRQQGCAPPGINTPLNLDNTYSTTSCTINYNNFSVNLKLFTVNNFTVLKKSN
jgi:hypothetical protein